MRVVANNHTILVNTFYAAFNYYEEWSFENLPFAYQNSPFVTLDSEIVEMKQPKTVSETTSKESNEEENETEKQQKSDETIEGENRDEGEFKEDGDVKKRPEKGREEEESGIGVEQEMQLEKQRIIRHDVRQSSDLQIGTRQKRLREESYQLSRSQQRCYP